MKTGYQFDFFVEQLTEEQANALIDVIVAFVEGFDTYMGGGHRPVEEEGPEPLLEKTARQLERKQQEQPNGKG